MSHAPDSTPTGVDSVEVRRNAAWFGAGVHAFGAYAVVGTVVTAAVMGIAMELLDIEGSAAAVSTGCAVLVVNALIGGLLGFRARRIARTTHVQIEQF